MHVATAPATPARGRAATFAAFRHPSYRVFWAGQAMFVFGQNVEWVALGWLVYSLTGSPFSLGLAGLAQAAPRMTLSLVGGAVADRVDRQRLVVIVQIAVAAIYVLLATLTTLGLIDVWHVMALAFLLGCFRSFDGPSRQALVPHLVEKDDLPSAVALSNLAWELPRTVGPAGAGVLIALVGVGFTFYVAALGLLAAALCFCSLRVTLPGRSSPTRNLLHNVVEGLTYIRRHEFFAALIGLVFFNSVFGMSYQILLPVFARDILQVGSEGFGLLQSTNAVGAILGSLAAAYCAQWNRRGWQALAGAVVFGFTVIGVGLSPWFPLSLALLFLLGFSSSLYMITINTVLQVTVPDEFRGRVLGVWALTWSLVPLGGTISGSAAELIGAPLAVALGGSAVVLMAIVVGLRVRAVREIQ